MISPESSEYGVVVFKTVFRYSEELLSGMKMKSGFAISISSMFVVQNEPFAAFISPAEVIISSMYVSGVAA